jgi:HD-GYP domain-containing protein (c-di-GMP phosphodiesterase class II)
LSVFVKCGETLRIAPEIVQNRNLLKMEERNIMKNHVAYGEELTRQSENIPQAVYDIVAQHHEREDGSGYPRGLFANQLNTFARMAAIVDCYQELVQAQTDSATTSTLQIFNQLNSTLSDYSRAIFCWAEDCLALSLL